MEQLRSDGVPASPSQDENDTNQFEVSLDVGNPMLNPVVVSRLLELCSLSDLPRLRLVSKEWYSLSLTRFRKEMWVVFSLNALQSLSDLLDAGGEPHFRNFRIMYVKFGHRPLFEPERPQQRNAMRSQFWAKCGGSIRKLHLGSIQIYQMEAFRRVIYEETPNLEELYLGRISNDHCYQRVNDNEDEFGFGIVEEDYEGVAEEEERQDTLGTVQPNLKLLNVESSESLPISWERVFSHFPNIEKLVLIPFREDATLVEEKATRFNKISQVMQRSAKEHAKFTVTELALILSYTGVVQMATRILQIQRLALSKLNLYFKMNAGDDEEIELLSTAFQLDGHTLESVSVTTKRSSPYQHFPFQPGPFPSLAALELTGNCCRNLHFLEHLPNLKVLKMVDANGNLLRETDSAIMEKICLVQLAELHLDFSNKKYITEEAMLTLVKVMPAVKIFCANLSNSSLRVVCREWKQLLTELRIASFSKDHEWLLDDKGITGIGSSDEQMANITDLKELKYFTIERGEGIGDASIWNGFLKLPQLLQLKVQLSSETSDEAFEALRKQFPASGGNKISRIPRARTMPQKL